MPFYCSTLLAITKLSENKTYLLGAIRLLVSTSKHMSEILR